jgi:hypothetical protein
MNDNDIIKALELCESPTCECTGECPMFHNGTNSISDCRGELHKNALDLINRLKAENERLNHIRAEQSKEIAALREKSEFLERVEAMRIEAEELFWEREEVLAQSDKERQESEAFERLMQIAEMTEGEDGNV